MLEQDQKQEQNQENKATIQLKYEGGTLISEGLDETIVSQLDGKWDERINQYRFPAYRYADLYRMLFKQKRTFDDQARLYQDLDLESRVRMEAFPYQKAALDKWIENKKKGIIVLPTGSGKSYLGTMAIAEAQRSSLIVVPTIDLMNQWYDILSSAFGETIGLIGGGYYDLQNITVTTYDSAYLYMERFGHKFGLLIFDECHHLPSETYSLAAQFSIAPFRLGLTATPERADGREVLLKELIGPFVYRKEITELSGEYLADYETVTLFVELTEEQKEEYQHFRQIYINFLRQNNISMASANGWTRFIIESSRSEEGRKAFWAYRKQKELFLGSKAKLDLLEKLLHQHRQDRMIIFTEDNRTVFEISRRFLAASITHLTKAKERRDILLKFNNGELRTIATSKVLNEGINVPEANVAVIISGNASVREHVQRLGRILRKREAKRAMLYEVITANTAEEYLGKRRRNHSAYE